MNKVFAIFLISLLPILMFGQEADVQESITKGDSAYLKNLYEEAIVNYEIVISQGYGSTQVYYNLGNAYFKMNKIPGAILNFERAKRLSPRDADIDFNLNVANSMIQDRNEAVPEIFYVKWWKILRNSFSLQNWTYFSIGIFIMIICCAGLFFLSRMVFVRRISFWAGIAFFVMAIFSFSMSYSLYNIQSNQLEAIVFAPTITAKHNPNVQGGDVFVIHEGTKVSILDESDDGWVNIKLANGSTGWIPVESVVRI